MGCCDAEDEENPAPETTERKCTDVFWLILYILFWFLMVIIAAFSFVYGNPLKIINGYDSFGNICGTNKNKPLENMTLTGIDTSSRPFLLFYYVKDLSNSLKMCVKECPNTTLYKINDLKTSYNQGNGLCRYHFDYSELDRPHADSLSGSYGPCPVLPVHESTPVLNRCVPKVAGDILSNFYNSLNNWDFIDQVLGDLYNTWKEILVLTVLSLVISLLTIAILHCLAHLVSYFIMIGFFVASIAGTGYLWYTYYDIKHNLDQTPQQTLLLESVHNGNAFFWYAIIATVITVIIIIIIIFMRKQVDFLADLFKETSKCLMHLPTLFFQPLFTFLVLILFFAFWLSVVLCLATASYPEKSSKNTLSFDASRALPTSSSLSTNLRAVTVDPSFTERVKINIVEYVDASWIKSMWWIYFIGLIWTSEFIMACQQMVIAGSVAHWYYRHKYKDNAHVCYATGKLVKYHLGSVALGSLIITIFKIPRLILTYIHEKMKRGKDKGSECASCGLKCCICCLYCLEKFIRYLNHNAYTVIAIDGSNFCKAAGTAFEVLTSHALQVATINSLGDFILFLGKCLVTAITGCVGLALFRRDPELKFYAVPTLLVCIFAFFVAHCILSLYEMVLDTVYLCMCQSGEPPEGIQMQNLGVAVNGNSVAPENAKLEQQE